ncbi:mitotic checkpoint protein-domain-containing protein [Chytridium lagenaria]|nr:mitotic checkpoint protein-domain-containing protein [Chytridium lagenaria]
MNPERFHPYATNTRNPATSFSSTRSPSGKSSPGAGRNQKSADLNDILENLDNALRTSPLSTRSFKEPMRLNASQHFQSSILSETAESFKRSTAQSSSSKADVNVYTSKVDADLMKARIEIRDLKRMLGESKNEYEHRLLELEKKKTILEVLQEEQKNKLTRADSNIEKLFKKYKELEEVSSKTIEELKEKLVKLREERKTRTALEDKVIELEDALSQKESLLNLQESSENYNTISKQFKDQVQELKSIEQKNHELCREISYLRSTKDNAERLKEEKASLLHQLEDLSKLREKLGETEMEVASLRAEKKKWSAFLELDDCIGFESPYALSKSLAKERLEFAMLKEKFGQENATQKGMLSYIDQLEGELTGERSLHAEAKTKYETLFRTHKRSEKTRELLQKEVQFCREQLRAYELEEEEMAPNFDRVKTERVHQLEQLCDTFKARISELEVELKNSAHFDASQLDVTTRSLFSPEAIEKMELLESEVSSLRKEKILLERELNSANEQLTILENAVGRGVCDISNMRILQMVDNPQSQDYRIRKNMLDALKKENTDLRQQIESCGRAGDVIPVSSLRTVQLECEEARRQIQEKEKRMMRLKEVYAAKAQEYREAVFSLVGYKVDFQEGRVKLVSTYSNPDDPSFLFTSGPNDEGTMQLVGGSSERLPVLQRARQYYIDERGSVPAFLASVTLAGWERENRK